MKKRSYIFMVAAMTVMLVAGCGDKKQNDTGDMDIADNMDTADNIEEEASVDAEQGGTSSRNSVEWDSTGMDFSDALEFNVSDYVKLGDYKGLEVTYPSVLAVTDEDVQEEIQYELEENIEYREVKDRAAKEGDTVNIDFTGTIDGQEFEGGSAEGYELELGAGDFLEDFEKNLNGKKAGESVVFKMTFPEDYDEDLGGKEVEFTVKVNSISQAVVPEYNVDFVKSVSDYETIKDYEASVREQLEADAQDESKTEAQENALNLAIENAEINGYPQKLYDFFYDDTVTGYKNYAELMGMDYEEFLKSFMTDDDIEEMVLGYVNEYLVVSAILEKEGQEISDSDYKKLAEEMAKENDYQTLEEYEADYGAIYLRTQLARERAVNLLYDSAKLTEVPYDEYHKDDSVEEEEYEEDAEAEGDDDLELELE